MEKTLTKSDINKTFTVLDDETGKFIEVALEDQRTASFAHSQVLAGTLYSAYWLKKIRDEKQYLNLGHGSFGEYVETTLPYGKATAYRMLQVMDKVSNVFPVTSPQQLLGGEDVPVNEINSMSMKSLGEITKLEDVEFEELFTKGSLSNGDTTLVLNEIKDMVSRNVAIAVKEYKKKYSDQHSQQNEKIKLLKTEKESLANDLQEKNEVIERARSKEKLFGAKAAKYDDKVELLQDAEDCLNKFNRYMNNTAISLEDAEELQDKFNDLVKKADEIKENLIANFSEVTTK